MSATDLHLSASWPSGLPIAEVLPILSRTWSRPSLESARSASVMGHVVAGTAAPAVRSLRGRA